MKQIILKNKIASLFDILGFSASTLCAVHCAILPFILSFLPLFGMEFMSNPKYEWAMLISSIFLAFTSFLIGYYKHHQDSEALSIMLIAFIFFVFGDPHNSPALLNEISFPIGGGIMAYAHYRNWKLCKEKDCKKCE